MKFDFDDILLTPAVQSEISSRKEINIYDENGMLPIFTAPMDTVVNAQNSHHFTTNKITAVLPRGEYFGSPYSRNSSVWYSYGLDEFKKQFIDTNLETDPSKAKYYALLDVANGHMGKVYDLAEAAKKKYGNNLVLMVGNIANPKTYKIFQGVADYVRCGIGGGSGRLTSVQTGVGYPMASLIKECANIRDEYSYNQMPKIVADGGMKNFADINKALALGADYVMLGGILNKAFESAGETFIATGTLSPMKISDWRDGTKLNLFPGGSYVDCSEEELFYNGLDLYKKYRGMSTKEVQKDWGRTELKTSEGITKFNKVEYTLAQWTENFQDYLRSAMSYCDAINLKAFIGKVDFERITENSFRRFNK